MPSSPRSTEALYSIVGMDVLRGEMVATAVAVGKGALLGEELALRYLTAKIWAGGVPSRSPVRAIPPEQHQHRRRSVLATPTSPVPYDTTLATPTKQSRSSQASNLPRNDSGPN